MPKRGDRQINSFTKGLITEVSPLSFPEGASLDESNMKLKKDGTRERRLGMDLETGYAFKDTGLSAEVLTGARLTAYRWSQASGNTHTEIGVIQVGNKLYFIDLLTLAPSANYLNGGNPLTFTGVDNGAIFSFATINNWLIIVSSGLTDPYAVSYDKDTDTITSYTAPIMVRDLWGVHDNLGENDRPTTLSPEHHYNLRNQGWDDSVVTTCGAGINAINCTFNTFGVYPGNGDQWSIGRVEDLTSADVDKYNPTIAARNLVNTGQVARGHYIIPLLYRGQSRIDQTGLLLPADQELGRFTTCASYAGRIFYSGILSKVSNGDNRSPKLSGAVFFSQTFTKLIDLVRCYQDADPTNPDFNEVIDTDGGYIVIPECSVINALKPIKQSLFVFAENGVWEIRGDEGGFRATSFQVNKISNIGVYSPKSIVEVNGTIFFWGNSGIYTISPNQFGTFDTNNITLQTIQRLYNNIPDSAKKNARGYHDNHTNTIRWMFHSDIPHAVGEPVDVVPPPPPVTLDLGEYFNLGSLAFNPKVAKMNTTHAAVLVRNQAFNQLQIRFIKLEADNAISNFNNISIFNSITGYDICRILDNKIAVLFTTSNPQLQIRTFDNDLIPISLIPNFLGTNYFTSGGGVVIRRVTDTKLIFSGLAGAGGNVPKMVIADLDGSDVATLGVSISPPGIVIDILMLTSTTGLIAHSATNGVTGTIGITRFTISGSTITLGDSKFYPSSEQLGGTFDAANDITIRGKLYKLSDTQAVLWGLNSRTGIAGAKPGGYIITDNVGVLECPTMNHFSSEPSRDPSYVPSLYVNGNKLYSMAHRETDGGANARTEFLECTISGNTITLDSNTLWFVGSLSDPHSYSPIGEANTVELTTGQLIYISAVFTDLNHPSTIQGYLTGTGITVG